MRARPTHQVPSGSANLLGFNAWAASVDLFMQVYQCHGKQAIGHRVMRLARQSFAGLSIERLRPGEYRELTRDELNQLKKKYLNPYRRARGASIEG